MSKGNLPKIFLDTDVAFDIISKRQPYFEDAIRFIELVAKNHVNLLIAESSLANLIYLTLDIHKINQGVDLLIDFISVCEIVSGGKVIMIQAIQSNFHDKEDALQYFTALHAGSDYFITRNRACQK